MRGCRAKGTSSGCAVHQATMRSNFRESSAMALISISSASMISGSRMGFQDGTCGGEAESIQGRITSAMYTFVANHFQASMLSGEVNSHVDSPAGSRPPLHVRSYGAPDRHSWGKRDCDHASRYFPLYRHSHR